jgi:hypothetical protein
MTNLIQSIHLWARLSLSTLIASAVIPTVITNAFYLPYHLLPQPGSEKMSAESEVVAPLSRVAEKTKSA